MKRLLSFILIISILLSISINIFATAEDGLDYDTAITINDFYDIPVVNCDEGAGLIFKFTAPVTAAYTIISISDYDIYGHIEDTDNDILASYGGISDQTGDFELVVELVKGNTYYICTDPDGVEGAVNYAMQISYEMTSGSYTCDAYTNNCVITAYSGSESSVTIPSTLGGMTVTGIDGDAFYQNTTLTSVTIPESVEYIGSDCFYGCTSLTTLDLTKGLKSIGAAAFEGCTSLTYLYIPPTVEEILASAFEGCSGLTQIDLCEGLVNIKSSAFEGCSSVSDITLPSTLRNLGTYAFSNCSSLSSVIIAEGLELVDRYAFRGCSVLTEIVFPESLTEIREYALRNCYALTDVIFLNPETVFASDDDIFYNCSGFTIHGAEGSTAQTYAETYSMAFERLDSVDPGLIDPGFESAQPLTESGEIISLNFNGEALYYTFEQSEDAEFSVEVASTFENPLKYEMYDADFFLLSEFSVSGNNSFSDVFTALPEGTYYIKVYPMNSTVGTGELCVEFATPPVSENSVFEYTVNVDGKTATITGYTAEPAGDLVIPGVIDGYKVTAIGDSAFYECSGFTGSLTIPDSVTLIGSNAFSRCDGLTGSLILPDSITSIGDEAFAHCYGFNGNLKISNSITSIGKGTFWNCKGFVGDLTIPDSVISIGDMAFCNCYGFKGGTLKLSNNLISIGEKAFYYCNGLTGSLTIPNSVTSIGKWAFDGCSEFTGSLIIPDSVTMLGASAFSLCRGLNGFLKISNSITKIEASTFSHCNGFTGTLTIPDSVTEIGTYAFFDCSGFTGSLSIPNSVISIASHVFDGCSGLGGILKIPESVTSIGENAFLDCENIQYARFYGDVPNVWGGTVFSNIADGFTIYYSKGNTSGWTSPTWTAPDGTVYNTDVFENDQESDNPSVNSGNALRVYEPTYEYIRQFKDNYATVYNNGVYSLVDVQNNHHYSTNQDGVGDYSEEIVAIYDADKHEITFTRLEGYSFAFIGYIWAGEFLGGKCVIVDEDGKYGLIDTSGNFIVDCVYDDIEYDMSDTVLLYSDSVWTPYTIGLDSTYSLNSLSEVTEIYNPVLSVTGEHIIASDGTAYGILTTDNVPLTTFEYDLIHDAEDGLFVGYRGDYVDLIETDGTVSATLTAYYVGEYSEGKLAVYDGTEFFYADKNGNQVVELSVEDVVSAEEFHESLAVICIDNKGYTYINTSGEIAVDSYWDYAAQFAEGYALVMNYITDGDGNMLRRWNVIDTEFNNVLTLEDDVYIDAADEHSADFSNGYIRTVDRNTGLMGFVQLESASSENIAGDLNEDETVSVKDVQYLLAYLISPEEYPVNAADADYNGDGEVNRADALYLLRYTILPERYPLSR